MSTNVPISSITLSAATSSITFSGIPQTYTDLVLVINGSMSGSGNTVYMRINNDSSITGFYSATYIGGNGTSAYSGRSSNTSQGIGLGAFQAGYSTGMYNIVAQIQNYSNTTTNKTLLSRWSDASSGGATETFVGLWRNTSAINSLEIRNNGSHNFNSGSTFNLYGVANASITNVAKATGGDSVYTDGTYWYHIFRSSGTFTPTQALTCDYLVVAGGGGGGSRIAGGGGAGGLRCTVTATGGGGSLESALSLTAQAYTVTVGTGGAGGVSMNSGNGQIGTQGSNSVFSSITSTGGGGGGAYNGLNATNGGSGGGNGSPDGGSTRGLGTANQGYNGGASITNQEGGGGGGAGAVGGAGSSSNGGTGGAGVTTSISGTSTTYAGGGGGAATGTPGSGGSGGGGAGANGTNNATSGTANTGSGGGGARNTTDTTNVSGGQGGSGIVIVRYAA